MDLSLAVGEFLAALLVKLKLLKKNLYLIKFTS
jgi:hypothetical protein